METSYRYILLAEMHARLPLLLMLFLAVVISAFAQPRTPLECPRIELEAPKHKLASDEEARFTVRITPKKPEWKFRYKWFLSEGEPLTGQDTEAITVRRGTEQFIDATVNIAGGPDDSICPVVSTNRATWVTENESASPPADCPTITVSGPAGIVMPGKTGTFVAEIRGLPAGTKPKVEWSLSEGEIVSGQGTTTIQVRVPEASVTATVRVIVPDGCVGETSETMPYCRPIRNVQLADLQPEDSLDPAELKAIAEDLQGNKSSQLVILVGYRQGKPSDRMTRRKEIVRDALVEAGLDPARITFRGVVAHRELMQFWRVPPGASEPTCDECEEEEQTACPAIQITGPAGQIYPGDTTIFTLNADLDIKGLKFRWTVSAGTITSGQGKPWVEVRSDQMSSNDLIIATVEISGLPGGCKNLASETAHIKKPDHPITLDEYERITVKEERDRLNAVAAEWKRFPHWYLYIVLYLAPKETRTSERARIKRIKDHLTRTHKIPEERLVFVNGGIFQRSTKIYGVAEAARKNGSLR